VDFADDRRDLWSAALGRKMASGEQMDLCVRVDAALLLTQKLLTRTFQERIISDSPELYRRKRLQCRFT
jgi:hypothetical protein